MIDACGRAGKKFESWAPAARWEQMRSVIRRQRTYRAAYSLALAKARPDPDFKYFSKAIARSSSVNAT